MINNTTLTKLKPFAKIGLVVLGLLSLVIIVTIIAALATKSKTKYVVPSPIPAIQPKKIQQPAQFEDEFSKLKNSLPYAGKGYTIEYLAPINAINIKITASSAEEFLAIKKDAENYIKQKGVNDICKLNIFWVPLIDSTTRKNLHATDLISSNCPVIPK